MIDISGSTANTFLGYSNGGTLGAGNAGNVAIGYFTLRSNTANANTAVGYEALYTNTTGSSNNAFGSGALFSNTSGQQNSGLGLNCLFHNTTGSSNSASGAFALFSNTTASGNTANGYQSLYSNTTGNNNNAFGSGALYSVTTAVNNCAFGSGALYTNSTGYGNIAMGYSALNKATFDHNVAIGDFALYSSNAAQDVGVGASAGSNITIGNFNTVIGGNSGQTLVSGSNNTLLGYSADVSSSSLANAGAFGNGAVVNASNKIRLGNSSVTTVETQTNYSTISDGRFKTNIRDEVKGLAFINKLKPVVYNYSARKFDEFLMKNMKKSKRDSILNMNDYTEAESMRRSGFIAQDVEKVAKEVDYVFDGLHAPKNDDDNYSLSYASFVVPLVKAVQELSAANDSLKNQLTELTQRIDAIELAQNKNSKASLQSSTSSDAISVNTASSLEQNSPNPFNSNTIIRYSIPANISNAKIIVTDISGGIVKEFSITNKGTGQVTINAGTLSSGSYIYSLFLNNKKIQSKQMILTK